MTTKLIENNVLITKADKGKTQMCIRDRYRIDDIRRTSVVHRDRRYKHECWLRKISSIGTVVEQKRITNNNNNIILPKIDKK